MGYIFQEVKIRSPDYELVDQEVAFKDFMKRIDEYKKVYQTIDDIVEANHSFMKIYNSGERVIVNRHRGNLQCRVVYYLMNIHIIPRSIYLSRHGESVYNQENRVGGNPGLSKQGELYAQALAQFIHDQKIEDLKVWTSEMKRAIDTARVITGPKERWKCLNEIYTGVCEEMTYEEIKNKYRKDFQLRMQNKFHYRYPKGEVS